jgi:hypothetical protein
MVSAVAHSPFPVFIAISLVDYIQTTLLVHIVKLIPKKPELRTFSFLGAPMSLVVVDHILSAFTIDLDKLLVFLPILEDARRNPSCVR